MGCSDSKETTQINCLRIQCDGLMKENISLLHLLAYLLLDQNNYSEALLLISLVKRTESYYSIIAQYRNYWITEAKAAFKSSNNTKSIQVCEKEQEKEKVRLNFTKTTLTELVDKLKPEWQERFENYLQLKESLETDPITAQKISSLYGSFYTEEKKVLKKAALKYCKNIEKLYGNVYKAVKSVTVNFYKVPENRIYFTHKIVHEKVDPEEKEEEKVQETINTKRERIIRSEDLEHLKSIEFKKFNSMIETISDPVTARRDYQESIDEELSVTSENYDEETIARLSYTQK